MRSGHLLEGSGVGYIPVAVLVGDGFGLFFVFGLFFGLFGLSVHNSGQMEIAGGRDESGGVEHPGFVVTCWVGGKFFERPASVFSRCIHGNTEKY